MGAERPAEIVRHQIARYRLEALIEEAAERLGVLRRPQARRRGDSSMTLRIMNSPVIAMPNGEPALGKEHLVGGIRCDAVVGARTLVTLLHRAAVGSEGGPLGGGGADRYGLGRVRSRSDNSLRRNEVSPRRAPAARREGLPGSPKKSPENRPESLTSFRATNSHCVRWERSPCKCARSSESRSAPVRIRT
jgi:hypothetical protein